MGQFPVGIYLTRASNKNTRTRCEICSKLTIKAPKRHHLPAFGRNTGKWRRFGVFIVNFEHILTPCSSVSIVNFEHVIAGWVCSVPRRWWKSWSNIDWFTDFWWNSVYRKFVTSQDPTMILTLNWARYGIRGVFKTLWNILDGELNKNS